MSLEILLDNDLKTVHNMDLFCDQGHIGPIGVNVHGIALPMAGSD